MAIEVGSVWPMLVLWLFVVFCLSTWFYIRVVVVPLAFHSIALLLVCVVA